MYDCNKKALFNLMIRHEQELLENKRLIEKQQKLDSIIETLRLQGADETEIEEIKMMITPAELQQIKHINDISNKYLKFNYII